MLQAFNAKLVTSLISVAVECHWQCEPNSVVVTESIKVWRLVVLCSCDAAGKWFFSLIEERVSSGCPQSTEHFFSTVIVFMWTVLFANSEHEIKDGNEILDFSTSKNWKWNIAKCQSADVDCWLADCSDYFASDNQQRVYSRHLQTNVTDHCGCISGE